MGSQPLKKRYFLRDLYLSQEFKKLYHEDELSRCKTYITPDYEMIFCSFCGQNLYSKPFFSYQECLQPFMCCQDCAKDSNQMCSKGHKPPESYMPKLFYKQLRAFCKWNCGKHFNAFSLYQHELNCEKRLPIPCPAIGCKKINFKNFSELVNHFEYHPNAILHSQKSILFSELKDKDLYLYFDHICLVFVRIRDNIKLKNVIRFAMNESQFKVYVNDKLIVINKEIQIKFTNKHVLVNFRVVEDFRVPCQRV